MDEMEVSGMNLVVTALTNSLNETAIWGVFEKLVPLIATLTLVALGFYLIRRVLKKVSKMRGGI